MILLKFVIITIALMHNYAVGFRILALLPHPGYSHFKMFHPIVRKLADIGHNVTVFSHFPDNTAPSNYIDVPMFGSLLTNGLEFGVSLIKIIIVITKCYTEKCVNEKSRT